MNTKGHPLKNTKVLLSKDYYCESCLQGKLITRSFTTKVDYESLPFLQKIQDNIYGPTQSTIGPFRPIMVLVDTSCKWPHDCSLSMCNVTFCTLTCVFYNALGTFYWIKA